jgi:hypothetical protein
MQPRPFVHLNPVWRERTNFIFGAWVPNWETKTSHEWEQLWGRQLAESQFEVCCIPFFVYNLGLGDVVEIGEASGSPLMIEKLVSVADSWTLRVFFKEAADEELRRSVLLEMDGLGCVLEFSSKNLLGICAPSSVAQAAMAKLERLEKLDYLEYEIGKQISP